MTTFYKVYNSILNYATDRVGNVFGNADDNQALYEAGGILFETREMAEVILSKLLVDGFRVVEVLIDEPEDSLNNCNRATLRNYPINTNVVINKGYYIRKYGTVIGYDFNAQGEILLNIKVVASAPNNIHPSAVEKV